MIIVNLVLLGILDLFFLTTGTWSFFLGLSLFIGLILYFIFGSSRNNIIGYLARSYPERKVISITWAPFGPGWYKRGNIIYSVQYRDTADNSLHTIFAQSGFMGAIYLKER